MSYIRRYFISGLLVWLPIWVTLLVIKFLVDMMSQTLSLLPHEYQPDEILGFHVPFIGVLITLLVIFVTGLIVANVIGRWLVGAWDALMGRIPIVRTVYTSAKQVSETLFTPGGQSFRKVLLVQYPHAGMWTIAFQTGNIIPDIQGALGSGELVSFYVPTTPNPTSGFLLIAPREDVIELQMSVDQALKFVISLGVVHPEEKTENGKSAKKKTKKNHSSK